MDTVTSINEKQSHRRASARGRKDKLGQETIVDLKPVKERLEYLKDLYKKSKSSSTEFSDAVKATAEKSGLIASQVRKFVIAKASDKAQEVKREAEQLALLFDETGEISSTVN